MLRITVDNKELKPLYDSFCDWVVSQHFLFDNSSLYFRKVGGAYIAQDGLLTMCLPVDTKRSEGISKAFIEDETLCLRVSIVEIKAWSQMSLDIAVSEAFSFQLSKRSNFVDMHLKDIGSITVNRL